MGEFLIKYQPFEFTNELREKITITESKLKYLREIIFKDYHILFSRKDIEFDVLFEREGFDLFTPPYHSALSVGVVGNDDEMVHTIWIWECKRFFLGLPVTTHIPGSKVSGNLSDQTSDHIEEELREVIEEFLSEV